MSNYGNSLSADRERYQAQMARNREIMDSLDTSKPALEQLYNNLATANQGLSKQISDANQAIYDLNSQPVSEYDDSPDPRDRTVIDRYGDGPPRIDHRSRY